MTWVQTEEARKVSNTTANSSSSSSITSSSSRSSSSSSSSNSAVPAEVAARERVRAAATVATAAAATAAKAIGDVMREIPLAIASEDPMHLETSLKGLEDGSLCAAAMCTGGGPGMMEAANRGAAEAGKGARSVGMGMSLPFEFGVNRFVDPELAFQFHYFFTRKFWMTYAAIAVIAAPGGVGTLDELMEIVTLKQCRKLKRSIPLILFGKTYWQKVINFDFLVESGMMDSSDRDSMFFTDDVDEAFSYLREIFVSGKLLLRDRHVHKSMRNSRATEAGAPLAHQQGPPSQ
ncbi:hypothetical protein Emed_004580 [Eimeria media]